MKYGLSVGLACLTICSLAVAQEEAHISLNTGTYVLESSELQQPALNLGVAGKLHIPAKRGGSVDVDADLNFMTSPGSDSAHPIPQITLGGEVRRNFKPLISFQAKDNADLNNGNGADGQIHLLTALGINFNADDLNKLNTLSTHIRSGARQYVESSTVSVDASVTVGARAFYADKEEAGKLNTFLGFEIPVQVAADLCRKIEDVELSEKTKEVHSFCGNLGFEIAPGAAGQLNGDALDHSTVFELSGGLAYRLAKVDTESGQTKFLLEISPSSTFRSRSTGDYQTKLDSNLKSTGISLKVQY